jgi:hypothetical protein
MSDDDAETIKPISKVFEKAVTPEVAAFSLFGPFPSHKNSKESER